MGGKKFYRVRGLGPGFDGLVVESREEPQRSEEVLLAVDRLTDENVVFGDRNLSLTPPPGSLFIEESRLVPIDDPGRREFDSKNPYGELVLDGRFSKENFEVIYSRFERTLCVTVREKIDVRDKPAYAEWAATRTIYSQNFNDPEKFDVVLRGLESLVKRVKVGDDLEDLVFDIDELVRG